MQLSKSVGRKILSVLLAAVIAVPACMATVQAESEGAGQPAKGEERTGFRSGMTLNEAIAGKEPSVSKYADDKVVIMFEGDLSLTKGQAKKTLMAGDGGVSDIKVEKVWNINAAEGSEVTDGTASIAVVSSKSLSGSKLVKRLAKRDDVRYAERNHTIHALSVSNDEYSDLQWSMQDKENAPHVGFQWNTKGTTGSDDKVVAIIDTGVDYTHPDLKDNMWKNTHYPKLKGECGYDFVNGDGDPKDDNGHGTHCAGVIGAVGNNGTGISGVNQKIRIMALKILDEDGGSSLAHEVAAYNYINNALDLGEPIVAINNSWGGGEESDIMTELIEIVGEKGAVTVCAAGNGSSNNDEYPDYPSGIDSDYIISVAAANQDQELAAFSNYGTTVDVAAPGTEILSTVAYNCYNPTIYNEAEQKKLSEKFNGFSDDSEVWGRPTEDNLYVNGTPYKEYIQEFDDVKEEKRPSITFGTADRDALTESGRSLEIKFRNMEREALICMPLTYTVKEGYKTAPQLSIMASADCEDASGNMFGDSLFGVIDAPADTPLTVSGLGELGIYGFAIAGKMNFWNHVRAIPYDVEDEYTENDPVPGEERKFIVLLYAYEPGDYTLRMDDIGLSSQDVSEDEFGKYEIMNGTSMAAPYITGAVALKAEEKSKDPSAAKDNISADVINEISSMVKITDPELLVGSEGLFDFSKEPVELGPRISRVTVDTDKDEIKIMGSGLAPSGTDVKVEIGDLKGTMKQAEIIEKDRKYLIVKNDGWINNIEDIRVTGYRQKTSVKKQAYLVKGKKEYEKCENSRDTIKEAMTTDGKYIYNVDSLMKTVTRFDPAQKDSSTEMVAEVTEDNIDDIFKIEKDKNKKYGLLFGKDLAYTNGNLYTIAEYGEAEEIESYYDFDEWSNGAKKKAEDDEDDEDDEEEGGLNGEFSIYSGEYRLLGFSTEPGGEPVDLGELPEKLQKAEDFTVAAYNGKLYVIGGKDHADGKNELMTGVMIYDPKKEKWSEGPSLPEGRAGGKAIQYMSMLVYTLSSDGSDDPSTEYDVFVLSGGKWEKTRPDKAPEALRESDAHDLSLVKDGILFTGAAVSDYGDTFKYTLSGKKFIDTGYNYIGEIEEYEQRAIAVGDTLYGFDGDGLMSSMPVDSGFVRVSVSKRGKGKVKGDGWAVPGNDVKITVKAGKYRHIKSLKAGSKKIRVKKNAAKKAFTLKKVMKDQKIKVKFVKNKKVRVRVTKQGKGKVRGAKKYYIGQKAKLTFKAAKGYYIKSLKVGKKNVKLRNKPAKKVYTIKKIKKTTKVKVIFAKK